MVDWGINIGSLFLNVVDVIIIVLAVMGAIAGAVRGFSIQFSSRAGFLVGIALALLFAKRVTNLVLKTFNLELLPSTVIAYATLFIVGFLITMAFGSLLNKVLTALHLGWLDHLLGFVWGAIEIAIIVSVLLFVLDLQEVLSLDLYFEHSYIVKHYLRPGIDIATQIIKGKLADVQAL